MTVLVCTPEPVKQERNKNLNMHMHDNSSAWKSYTENTTIYFEKPELSLSQRQLFIRDSKCQNIQI